MSGGFRARVLWLWTCACLTALLILGTLKAWHAWLKTPLEHPLAWTIAKRESLWSCAQTGAAAGFFPQAWVGYLMLRARGQVIRFGEYDFPRGIAREQVLDSLRQGQHLKVYALTIPEGLTSAQVAERLNQSDLLAGPPVDAPAEGTLLPDTYHVHRGDSRQALLKRMQEAMEQFLQTYWPERPEGSMLSSPQAWVTLASIVEKETALPEERPEIAAVFHNRLRRRMRLQADPTVVYALTQGRSSLGRALTKADLASPSPYNTYHHEGMPPGPIANPGRESLLAALLPKSSKSLYFVANGQGGHSFSETLAVHNTHWARWRRLKKRASSIQSLENPVLTTGLKTQKSLKKS